MDQLSLKLKWAIAHFHCSSNYSAIWLCLSRWAWGQKNFICLSELDILRFTYSAVVNIKKWARLFGIFKLQPNTVSHSLKYEPAILVLLRHGTWISNSRVLPFGVVGVVTKVQWVWAKSAPNGQSCWDKKCDIIFHFYLLLDDSP